MLWRLKNDIRFWQGVGSSTAGSEVVAGDEGGVVGISMKEA